MIELVNSGKFHEALLKSPLSSGTQCTHFELSELCRIIPWQAHFYFIVRILKGLRIQTLVLRGQNYSFSLPDVFIVEEVWV